MLISNRLIELNIRTCHIKNKPPVQRGRPAGMRARNLELKHTLLEHPDVPKVLEKVIRTALDDNHKNQAVAQTLMLKATAIAPMENLTHILQFKPALGFSKDEKKSVGHVWNLADFCI